MTDQRVVSRLVAFLLAVATALVVALALALRDARASQASIAARNRVLQPGMYAPRLALPTTEGDTLLVAGTATECQVVLIYDTSCDFCRATIPSWNEIAAEADGFDVVGVSLDSLHTTRRYAETHALRYPSVVLLDPRERSLLRAATVPQTLLVASEGLVLFSRPGVMTSAAMDSLRMRIAAAPTDRCRGASS